MSFTIVVKIYFGYYTFSTNIQKLKKKNKQLPQDRLRLTRGEYTPANSHVMLQETPQSYQFQNARRIQANTDDI